MPWNEAQDEGRARAFLDCAPPPARLKPSCDPSFAADIPPLSVDADIDALAARDLGLRRARGRGGGARIFQAGGAHLGPGRDQGRRLAGHRRRSRRRFAAQAPLARRVAGGGLALGGDDRRFRAPRAPQPHRRRPDRRHSRIRDRRSALGGVSRAHRRRGPIAGVVHAPALDETYAGARGGGATFNGAPLAAAARWPPRAAAGPKPIIQAMAAKLGSPVEITPRVPSLAYRLCMAALGAVDFAVAAENSHDWDIAAADLLLEEAGARLIDGSGEPLLYNARQVRRARAPRRVGGGPARPDRGLSRRDRLAAKLTAAAVIGPLAFLPRRRQRPAGEPAPTRINASQGKRS